MFNVAFVIGPFNDSSVNYLLVSDYRQRNIYQLQPATGELRSLFTDGVYTVALALDPQRKIVYLAHAERIDYRVHQQYHIRKRSFDGNIDFVVYSAQSGSSYCITMNFMLVFCF